MNFFNFFNVFFNLLGDNFFMQIKLLVIGKLKEKSYRQISDELSKRIRPYCSFSIVEISAENLKEVSNDEIAQKKEAEKIISQIDDDAFIITLEIEGKMLDSVAFSQKIQEISNTGINKIIFIIGGATGLHPDIKKKSDFAISFSKMTFTHQFVRLILQEQLYRSFKILNNEPYHK